jgi:hypothetical protein
MFICGLFVHVSRQMRRIGLLATVLSVCQEGSVSCSYLTSVKFQHNYLKLFCLEMCEFSGAEYSYCEVRGNAVYGMLRTVSDLCLYR